MSYHVFSIKERPDLREAHDKTAGSVWPEFMLHDPILNDNWGDLFQNFPECQITFLQNDEIIGIANSLPLYWDMPFEKLPEKGWDWVLLKGLEDKKRNIEPSILNGLQIVVDRNHQGKGLSSIIIRELISIARQKRYKHMTIPVRPNLKSKYPLIPISKYIEWKREDGLPFDPWIRVHVKLGARIIKPCHQAMYIPGSISEWEQWTGMKFPDSGEYIIGGALIPIEIDYIKGIGEYIEPNVWMVHDITL